MRKLVLIALVGLLCALAGCGGGSNTNLTPLSEEQKRKIAEEDKRIADEESQGSVNKPRKAGKR
jgi:hypothetical protein